MTDPKKNKNRKSPPKKTPARGEASPSESQEVAKMVQKALEDASKAPSPVPHQNPTMGMSDTVSGEELERIIRENMPGSSYGDNGQWKTTVTTFTGAVPPEDVAALKKGIDFLNSAFYEFDRSLDFQQDDIRKLSVKLGNKTDIDRLDKEVSLLEKVLLTSGIINVVLLIILFTKVFCM